MSSMIVTLDKSFKVETGLFNILQRNINKAVNTLLIGETGCGNGISKGSRRIGNYVRLKSTTSINWDCAAR